jgi:NADPH:quinone reductase-like Zn-dependent oxidoreductase
VNPGDVKKREDAFGVGMPYPRVIPHSDGSGTVDAVGEGVSREWIGRRVCGATALKVTVLSARRPSTLWFL